MSYWWRGIISSMAVYSGEGWDILLPVDPAVSNPGCTPELLGGETLARLAPEDGEACRKHIKFVTCRTS